MKKLFSQTLGINLNYPIIFFYTYDQLMQTNMLYLTVCVGFQRSEGSSPLCGSSTGGCRIEIQTSPFWNKITFDSIRKHNKNVCYISFSISSLYGLLLHLQFVFTHLCSRPSLQLFASSKKKKSTYAANLSYI